MNATEKEIINLYGEKLLENILNNFKNGFHIVAVDETSVVVGDKNSNVSYSRKTFKLKETYVFNQSNKLSRKFG